MYVDVIHWMILPRPGCMRSVVHREHFALHYPGTVRGGSFCQLRVPKQLTLADRQAFCDDCMSSLYVYTYIYIFTA